MFVLRARRGGLLGGVESWLIIILPLLFMVQALLYILPFLWEKVDLAPWGPGYRNLALLLEGCFWVIGTYLLARFMVKLRSGLFWVRGLSASCITLAIIPVFYIIRNVLVYTREYGSGLTIAWQFLPSNISIGLVSITLLVIGLRVHRFSSPSINPWNGLDSVKTPFALLLAFFGSSIVLRWFAFSSPTTLLFIWYNQDPVIFWRNLMGLVELIAGFLSLGLAVVVLRSYDIFPSRGTLGLVALFSVSWAARCLSEARFHGQFLGGGDRLSTALIIGRIGAKVSLAITLLAFSVVLFSYIGFHTGSIRGLTGSGAQRSGSGKSELDQPEEAMMGMVRAAIRDLREIELESSLEAEIMENLVGERRTTEELVSLIYNISRDSESYPAYYMRVKRAAKRLGEKGLVSIALFGREKPYRLTSHALDRLLAIRGQQNDPHLVPVLDRILYGALGVVLALTWVWAATGQSQQLLFYLSLALVFLTGLATCRFLETLRRVL